MLLSREQTGFVERTAAEGVILDAKAQTGATSDFPNSRLFIFGSELGNYSHRSFPQLPECKLCPSNGHTQCHCLADSKKVDS